MEKVEKLEDNKNTDQIVQSATPIRKISKVNFF